MVNAIVLLKVKRDSVNSIADSLADMNGISEVYSVAGKYDLAVIIRVKTNDDMALIVTESLLKIDGILDSETMMAFKVHSKHDLESMFSLGQ